MAPFNKQCDECYCLILNFTHRALQGGNKFAEVNQHSEQMLDELEKDYPAVFIEPKYSIWEQRQPF